MKKPEKWFQFLGAGQKLVYILLSLMPSQYQRENLEAMLSRFLEAQGHPLPQYSKAKSASALSRFLNIHHWSTQQVIRTTRNYRPLANFVRDTHWAQTDVAGHY